MVSRLVFEGWRGIHHSYALVAQAHCLSLLRRPDVLLRFRDLPYHSTAWRRTRGIFDTDDESRLDAIPAPEPGFRPHATINMRAERPDFTPAPHGRKFVFGTPEFRVLREENLVGARSAREVHPDVHVITPSQWTALAYERFGFTPDRVHVVPHGIDPRIMHPDVADRELARRSMGLRDEFVFMSVGAMTANKGIDLLLAGFAQVSLRVPDARLVLKGADALYPSQEFVRAMLNAMPAVERERVASRLLYHGATLTSRQIVSFLRAADCYVAPYRAEGFNMPVMEAAASGVPVICTAGGATDEFTTAEFAQHVRSTRIPVALSARQTGEALAPDFDHLVDCMLHAAHRREETSCRGGAGAAYMVNHYTWDSVTDRLLGEVLQ